RGRGEISVRCSSTMTSAPSCARSTAASMPTGPPPTMATSCIRGTDTDTGTDPDCEQMTGVGRDDAPPGGHFVAQFRGREAATQRREAVGADEGAGEERRAQHP